MHLQPTRSGDRANLPGVTDHAAPVSLDALPLFDVLLVGGGFSGLRAALYTARGMKSGVLVSDGLSRTAPSPHAGGVFSRDRRPPGEILAAARDDLRPYDFPVLVAEVTAISGGNGDSTATLSNGQTLRTRKVILATGMRDVLPDIPARLQAQWGLGVHHCPYCYGWELRGGQVAVHLPGLSGVSGVQSVLYHQKLTRDVLMCADREVDLTPEQRDLLLERGVTLTFASGRMVDRDVLYAHGRRDLRADLAEALGYEVTASGITVDAQQMTTVPGVYACGDVTKGNQIAFAGGAIAAMQAAYAIFYDTLPDGARA